MSLVKPTIEELRKKHPELKDSDIQMIREWCEKQPHLPNITDSEIALFLHSNYYRLEPTKATIENYFTVRTHVTEFFTDRDLVASQDLKKIVQTVSTTILKGRTREGYAMIYGGLLDPDPSHYVYNDAMRFFNMVMDLWMYQEGPAPGHIIIFDVKNVSIGHVGRLSPLGLKKYLYYLQEALPVRLKGLHFLNTSPVMDMILSMMKPFMKKELMQMLHMHSSMESCAKELPLEALPIESGGKGGCIKDLQKEEIKLLEENREWFLETDRTKRVNESLRVGKAKTAEDLFGVAGSFKKLDID